VCESVVGKGVRCRQLRVGRGPGRITSERSIGEYVSLRRILTLFGDGTQVITERVTLGRRWAFVRFCPAHPSFAFVRGTEAKQIF